MAAGGRAVPRVATQDRGASRPWAIFRPPLRGLGDFVLFFVEAIPEVKGQGDKGDWDYDLRPSEMIIRGVRHGSEVWARAQV
jgi:hypothetical protein